MLACVRQATLMKELLLDYAESISLKVNFQKSILVPINILDQTTMELAAIFQCSVGTMPFTYLSLPMGTTRPSVADLMLLVDHCPCSPMVASWRCSIQSSAPLHYTPYAPSRYLPSWLNNLIKSGADVFGARNLNKGESPICLLPAISCVASKIVEA